MYQNRRNFIKKAGILAASPIVLNQFLACKSEGNKTETTPTDASTPAFKLEAFGIQLWTVKEDMAKDAKATLKSIADYGYKQVESFEGEKGIFWGMKPAEFKTYLDEIGLSCISSHCNPAYSTDKTKAEEFKKLADDAASVGIKYLLNPFPGEYKTKAEWIALAEGLNKQGEICKAAGIRAGYHNHHFEFEKIEGDFMPEQYLLENTDPALVDFELDIYWNVKSGQNPEEWFKKYKNRFKLCHVKDLFKEERVKEIESTEKSDSNFWPLGASTTLGNGRIDFPTILQTAKENGVEYFIVEQERFDNSSPLQDAGTDADYMKQFVG